MDVATTIMLTNCLFSTWVTGCNNFKSLIMLYGICSCLPQISTDYRRDSSLFSRIVLICPQCLTLFLSLLAVQTCMTQIFQPSLVQQTRTEMTGQKDSAIFLLALHLCNESRIAAFLGKKIQDQVEKLENVSY